SGTSAIPVIARSSMLMAAARVIGRRASGTPRRIAIKASEYLDEVGGRLRASELPVKKVHAAGYSFRQVPVRKLGKNRDIEGRFFKWHAGVETFACLVSQHHQICSKFGDTFFVGQRPMSGYNRIDVQR